ncbi:hypothetical protein YC2023_110457 [Brassica napus]
MSLYVMVLAKRKAKPDETFCVQDEFVEGDLTSFADMKRSLLSHAIGTWFVLMETCLHEIQPFKPKFWICNSIRKVFTIWDLIVDANDKGVEIATAGGETNA